MLASLDLLFALLALFFAFSILLALLSQAITVKAMNAYASKLLRLSNYSQYLSSIFHNFTYSQAKAFANSQYNASLKPSIAACPYSCICRLVTFYGGMVKELVVCNEGANYS